MTPNPPVPATPGAIPGAFQDSHCIIVPTGADVSHVCFCCGRPRAGNAIIRRLRPSMGSASGRLPASIRLLEMALQTLFVVVYMIDNVIHPQKR
jgi:hypothetical protein